MEFAVDVSVKGVSKLEERFAWNVLDYAYPDQAAKEHALLTGEFIPGNGIPVGVEVWRDKLFVTVPRWRKGMIYPCSL